VRGDVAAGEQGGAESPAAVNLGTRACCRERRAGSPFAIIDGVIGGNLDGLVADHLDKTFDRPDAALALNAELVKSPIGAGEVLIAAEIPMEFHAIRKRAKFVLDEMLDALLDVS